MKITEEMLQAAMKEAVARGLVPKVCAGEDEYLRCWQAVEAVLRASGQEQRASVELVAALAAPQAPAGQQAEPASRWTLQGHQLATSGKEAWACRAFDPDAAEGGAWGEWRLTSYKPPRPPDRWFEVVALPALTGQQANPPKESRNG